MSYNGWSNRATWNVSPWLNNDEGSYRELQNLVRQADTVGELAEMKLWRAKGSRLIPFSHLPHFLGGINAR